MWPFGQAILLFLVENIRRRTLVIPRIIFTDAPNHCGCARWVA